MAKKETKQTYNDSKALGQDVKTQYNTAIGDSKSLAGEQQQAVNDQRASLTGNYNAMMAPPTAYNPTSYSAAHASAQGYDAAQADAARKINDQALTGMAPDLSNFAKTGGINPDTAAGINDTANQLKTNGGLTDENIARIRGLGGFDEFAKTGGYTPEAIANIKAQALSPIGSYATGTRDELARRSAVQGGYAPGFDAANRQLRRDTSRAIADTSLNANVSIQDRINQGRQWGIGGLSNAETQIGGMRQQGLQSSAAIQQALQNLTSQYMAQGLSLQEANAQAQADIDKANVANEVGVNTFNVGQRNDASAFGANASNQASMFNAGADNSAGMFNANNANQGQIFNITNAQDQYAKGVGGLQNLQDQSLAQLVGERDRQQQLLGSSAQGQLGALGIQSDLAKQPGVGGNIIAGIGAASGLASTVMSGGMSGLAKGAISSGVNAANDFQSGGGSIGPYGNYLG